jgi:hypothetical protein
MSLRKLLVLIAAAVLIGLYFAFDLGRWFSLDALKASRPRSMPTARPTPGSRRRSSSPCMSPSRRCRLPGAAIMTLAGGAVFGLLWGTVLVSFASSFGATLAFLASRFLLRDWVQARFGERLRAINLGVEKEGGFYLFTLRLVPAFPFFMINLLMGLTPMRVPGPSTGSARSACWPAPSCM